MCVYHFVVNKKTSRSGISSSDEFLVVLQTIDIFANSSNSLTYGSYSFCTVDRALVLCSEMEFRVPTLTHVIPSQGIGGVLAVTSLGDEVFVVHLYNGKRVEVYDAETFTLQRHITVPGLRSPASGLAACAVNHCIYASDWDNDRIHRVELSGSNAVKKWSVVTDPRGLSVNKAHNVVVACDGANKLQEYTTHGSLVRETCLQAGVTDPWHAIQLSTGHYAVSQQKSPGVVSVVGVDGQVIHSYGPSQTSDVGQMNYPKSLVVTKNDDIYR